MGKVLILVLLGLPFFAVAGPACDNLCDTIHTCAARIEREEHAKLLCLVAKCETGNKCKSKIRSPNGKYKGAFQFLPRTWKSLCVPMFKKRKITSCLGKDGSYDSCCATMCAAEIVATQANGGLRNWPHCGKRALATLEKDN